MAIQQNIKIIIKSNRKRPKTVSCGTHQRKTSLKALMFYHGPLIKTQKKDAHLARIRHEKAQKHYAIHIYEDAK